MKLITILGTRPELTKLSPVLPLFDSNFSHKVIHTGQHYSFAMDKIFFDELKIRKPDYHLDARSGNHGEQTAYMLVEIEKILLKEKPDMVLVFADPNTPLAGALAACKLHITLIHMEAGTRSFNKKMPEEINRILIDHCSNILLAPDQKAVQNLENEGIKKGVFLVGSTAYDACLRNREIAKKSEILREIGVTGEFVLVTIHRAENTNNEDILRGIIDGINNLSNKVQIVIPLHPRTQKLAKKYNMKISEQIKILDPLGYLKFLKLLDSALFVMSDSGGIQEEAAALNTPCLILRTETEWTYLTELGKNILVGTNPAQIVKVASELLDNRSILLKMSKIKVNFKKNVGQEIVRILKNVKR